MQQFKRCKRDDLPGVPDTLEQRHDRKLRVGSNVERLAGSYNNTPQRNDRRSGPGARL